MIRRFIRHVKEGFVGVGRHAAMSLSSASAITITLILIGIFMLTSFNLQSITVGVENSVKISALVSYDAENDLDRIEKDIKSVSGVKEVVFSSKEDELEFYLSDFSEEDRELFMPQGAENPMHDAFYVETYSGDIIQDVAKKISNIDGICEINYGGDGALSLVEAMKSVRTGGFILVIALSLLAIYLVQNTIKLTIMARANEIWIMRNVGAKNGFIRAPFLIEGMILGFLGAILPVIFTIYAYIYIYNLTGGYLLSKVFVLLPPHPFVLYVALILVGIGVFVGFVGSFISVTKYLRWKR